MYFPQSNSSSSMSHSWHKISNVIVSSGGAGAAFTHTLSVSYTPLGACCWELCARDVWHGVSGLTSTSSAAAADSQRRGPLCAATPESAGCASEETDWEETGRSRATAAASPAPCWACVMDRQHVKCSSRASCCESWFASRSILVQRHMGGWLYFTSTSESTSNFSFFCTVCTSYCINKEIYTKE